MNLTKSKVLVVDDNPRSMDLISQILLGFGVKSPTKCVSAAEARAVLASDSFDVALIDDEMPDETGLDLVNHIRADPRGRNYTLACILLSSHASQDKVAHARDAGCNFVVSKPITPAVLLGRIEWIAREDRAFVTSDGYRGPDRRFKSGPLPAGQQERRAEALRMMAEPEKALSQDEISSLFG